MSARLADWAPWDARGVREYIPPLPRPPSLSIPFSCSILASDLSSPPTPHPTPTTPSPVTARTPTGLHHHTPLQPQQHITQAPPYFSAPHSSANTTPLTAHTRPILADCQTRLQASRPRNRPEPVCPTQAVCLPDPGTSLPLLQVSQPLCDLHSAIRAPWDIIF